MDTYPEIVPQAVTVDLRGSTIFELSELAALATLARRIASEGGAVEILLPGRYRGQASRSQVVLSQYGFVQLFESASAEPWRSNLFLSGHGNMPMDGVSPDFFPMRWIAQSSFKAQNVRLDVRNELNQEVVEDFTRVLSKRLGARHRFIDNLLDTVFLELGENAVLHSALMEGSGAAVVCGEFTTRQGIEEFHCSVVDAGIGIQKSLARAYDEMNIPYHLEVGWNRHSAMIRYALEGGSRRFLQEREGRMAFRSSLDRIAQRGLPRLSRQLLTGERFRLSSNGYSIEIEGGQLLPEPRNISTTSRLAPFGVRAEIVLQLGRAEVSHTPRKRALQRPLESLAPEILVAVDPVRGVARPLAAIIEEAAAGVSDTARKLLVIDLGYTDERAEHAVDVLSGLHEAELLGETTVLWNVRSSVQDIKYITRQTSIFQNRNIGVVCDSDQSSVLCQDLSVRHGAETLMGQLQEGQITASAFVHYQRQVNSKYLALGIASADGEGGFYNSSVRLPSGRLVDRFFSVPANSLVNMQSNGRRWVSTGVGLLKHVCELTGIDTKAVKILAFSNSILPVVQKLGSDSVFSNHVYLWQPYDSPTRADLEKNIKPGEPVALLTDAVATGTLRDAVLTAVQAVGAVAIGTAVLVDAGHQQSPIRANTEDRGPMLGGASFPIKFINDQAVDSTHRLERFSSVPEPTRTPRSLGLDRVRTTVDLINKAAAAQVGHFADGGKHATIVIETSKLIPQLTLDDLKHHLNDKLSTPDGQQPVQVFMPTLIVHPTQPTNLLTFPTTQEEQTAAILARTVSQTIFPHVPVIEISRLRDTDGSSQCVVPIASGGGGILNWESLLIVDDGLSTGNTARQLIQIGVERGTLSVVVLALLARARLSDVEWWESLESLRVGGHAVSVRFIFPFVLPVPFYSPQACPVADSTRMLRRARHQEEPIGPIAEEMLSRFAASRPGMGREALSEVSRETWVDIRTFAALAEEEKLSSYDLAYRLELLNEPAELMALFRVFLYEQALLDHPALRRDLPPIIFSKIHKSLISHVHHPELIRDAVALLRARSVRDFLTTIVNHAKLFVTNWKILGDCIVHLDTIPLEAKSKAPYRDAVLELQEVTQGLQRRSASAVHSGGRPWLGLLTWLYIEGSRRPPLGSTKPPIAIARELRRCLRRTALHHDLVEKLEAYERLSSTLGELEPSNYQLYYISWVSQYLPYIMREVVPGIAALRSSLLLLAGDRTDYGDEKLRLLTAGGREVGTIESQIRGIGKSLEFLGMSDATPELRSRMAKNVESLCTSLLDGVFREESVIRTLLEDAQSQHVRDIVEDLRRQIELELTTHRVRAVVRVQGNWSHLENRSVFCAASAIRTFIGNAAMNIARYGYGSPRRVIIWVRESEINDESSVRILILSRGPFPPSHTGPGDGTTAARQQIEFFGGEVADPTELNLSTAKWISQQLSLQLW